MSLPLTTPYNPNHENRNQNTLKKTRKNITPFLEHNSRHRPFHERHCPLKKAKNSPRNRNFKRLLSNLDRRSSRKKRPAIHNRIQQKETIPGSTKKHKSLRPPTTNNTNSRPRPRSNPIITPLFRFNLFRRNKRRTHRLFKNPTTTHSQRINHNHRQCHLSQKRAQTILQKSSEIKKLRDRTPSDRKRITNQY